MKNKEDEWLIELCEMSQESFNLELERMKLEHHNLELRIFIYNLVIKMKMIKEELENVKAKTGNI